MAFLQMNVFSESLGMQTTVNVLIPQRSTVGQIGTENSESMKKYRCLYLLHGLSDDHTIWMRRTAIERYADKYGICVVMPCGGRGFYTDMQHGEKYYTYISQELPSLMQEFFNVSEKREDNFIAGNSMGGYGALKIAMKCPQRFCAAAGLSSVADIERATELFSDVLRSVFGDELAVPDSENLFKIATEKNKDAMKPRIYMSVGTEDFMYEDNVRLKQHFENLDYDFSYSECVGDHSWNLWDEHIKDVLEWMFK